MSSMAQDAIDMGLDPVIAPDGKEWCESSYEQSYGSKEIWGDLKGSCSNYNDCDNEEYESYDDNESYDNNEENNDVKIIFDIGDIVKLNSNNDITMTIQDIYDDIIVCRWFDKNHILQSAEFNQLELTIIQKN